MALSPFHIAFPVDDLAGARAFYGTTLGCAEGRSSDHWVDFDFFGHQIVAHLKPRAPGDSLHHTRVDGHEVPVPHFGVVLPIGRVAGAGGETARRWREICDRATYSLRGQVGEQATMFFL